MAEPASGQRHASYCSEEAERQTAWLASTKASVEGESMTIKEFADQYRVKTRRDSCNEEIIPGKPRKANQVEDRSHVYDHGDGSQFGVCLLFQTARKWELVKRRLLVAGFTLWQDGDIEGALLFDPTNPEQSRAALKEAGIKFRRVLTVADRKARSARVANLQKALKTSSRNGFDSNKNASRSLGRLIGRRATS
jgi:hypothetical protein